MVGTNENDGAGIGVAECLDQFGDERPRREMVRNYRCARRRDGCSSGVFRQDGRDVRNGNGIEFRGALGCNFGTPTAPVP